MPEVPRPCPPITLVSRTPIFDGEWGTPQEFDVDPWDDTAPAVGFEAAFTVHDDYDWDAHYYESGSAEPYRYVLVPTFRGWELRAGRTHLAAIDARTGGRHDHMLSAAELAAAQAAGTPVRSGWIYEIAADHIRIG